MAESEEGRLEVVRARTPVPLVGFGAVAGGLLGFVLLASTAATGDPHWLDRAILLGLRTPGDPADPVGPELVEKFVTDITALGGRSVLGLVGVLLAGFLALARQWWGLVLLLVTLVGGSVLSDAMKLLFERPRPDLVAHLVMVHSPSFPSGHATNSALACLTFGALLARALPGRMIKLYAVLCAIFMTMLIGFSRVFLGVHYPSDVLAGWCLGSAWAMSCWSVANFAMRRRSE